MKVFIISVFILLFTTLVYSQEVHTLPKCYSIAVVTKDSVVDQSMILPAYQNFGFLLIRNGIYDFIIDRKRYLQAVLISIDENGFFISTNWKFDGDNEVKADSLYISIDQDIRLRLASIDNGVIGMPIKISRKNYSIQIVDSGDICGIQNIKVKSGVSTIYGHYYFTAYGWKKVILKNGNPYICENNEVYLLRRK